MVSRPLLQKHEHAETTPFDGIHIREINYDNSGTCLQGHGFAQFESSFALHKSALALNDRQFTDILNAHIQHDFLPPLVLSNRVLCTWSTSSTIPAFCIS